MDSASFKAGMMREMGDDIALHGRRETGRVYNVQKGCIVCIEVHAVGWSDKVRDVAERDFVRPARQHGGRVRIRFGDLKSKMVQVGFPPQNANQIASPIESEKFWKPLGLEMCTPKGQSRRVDTIFEFRFVDEKPQVLRVEDDPLLQLAGILKGAIREGADAFIREVRRDKETGQ